MRQAVKSGIISMEEVNQNLRVPPRASEAVFDFLVEQEELEVKKKEDIIMEN